MNIIKGIIQEVEQDGELVMVRTQLGDKTNIYSIVVKDKQLYPKLCKGTSAVLHFKETEVILFNSDTIPCSIVNQIKGEINSIQKNALLAEVTLTTYTGEITAIVPTRSLDKLDLKQSDLCWASIKTNEIMLSV